MVMTVMASGTRINTVRAGDDENGNSCLETMDHIMSSATTPGEEDTPTSSEVEHSSGPETSKKIPAL